MKVDDPPSAWHACIPVACGALGGLVMVSTVGSNMPGGMHALLGKVILRNSTAAKHFVRKERTPVFEHIQECPCRGPLDLEGIRELARDVGGALEHARRLGICHHDTKPDNIFWAWGRWVVGDWGSADWLEQTPREGVR